MLQRPESPPRQAKPKREGKKNMAEICADARCEGEGKYVQKKVKSSLVCKGWFHYGDMCDGRSGERSRHRCLTIRSTDNYVGGRAGVG